MSGANDRPDKARSPKVAYGLALALAGAILVTLRLRRGPGQMADADDRRREEIRAYVVGYALALALTGAAFAAVRWPSFAHATTLAVVLGLALVQMGVHLRFFLHVGLQRSTRENLQLILFSTLIMLLMVSGTLVVLANLRERMM